jgi:uroporphyrinogen-III synthase
VARPLVLVTRPEHEAADLVRDLAALGVEAASAPMLQVALVDGPPLDLSDVRAILATSRNGVRALAARTRRRDLPVYAVGDGTAAAASEFGFAPVESASGDAADLVALVMRRLPPGGAPLLHAAGRDRARDVGAALRAQGYPVRTEILYQAQAATALPPAARDALGGGTLSGVAFFSPRTARTFGTLVADAGLADACRGAVALCLSTAVADAARTLPWRGVRIADRPDREAIVRLVADLAESPMADPNGTDPKASDPRPASSGAPPDDPVSQADAAAAAAATAAVIERFGGIRPTAAKLDVPVTTVQGWKKRGHVPINRHADLKAAAARLGIELTDAEIAATASPEEQAAARAAALGVGGEAAADEPARRSPWGPAPEAAPEAAPPAETPTPARPLPEDAPAGAQPAGTEPAPAAVEPQRSAPEPERRSGGSGLAWVALVGAAAAIVVAVMPYFEADAPAALPAAAERRIAALERRAADPPAPPADLSPLEARVAALEGRPTADAGAGEARAALDERLAAAERRLAELAERLAALDALRRQASDLAAALERVEGRLAGVDEAARRAAETAQGAQQAAQAAQQAAGQAQQAAGAARQAGEDARARAEAVSQELRERGLADAAGQAMVLAASQLRDAVEGGRLFAAQLEAVRSMVGDLPGTAEALDALAPAAQTGVPTRAALIARAQGLGGRIVRAERSAAEGGTWVDEALGRLGTLVTVRRGAPAPGETGTEAAVARAEAAIAQGDIEAAVEHLSALDGAAAAAAAPWVEAARSRLAAERAAEALGRAAAERISGGGASR